MTTDPTALERKRRQRRRDKIGERLDLGDLGVLYLPKELHDRAARLVRALVKKID